MSRKFKKNPPLTFPKSSKGQEDIDTKALDSWSAEAATGVVQQQDVAPAEQPAEAQEPWDLVSDDAVHAYHINLPKKLWVQMEEVWMRTPGARYRSARQYVIEILEKAVHEELEAQGRLKSK